MGFEPGQLDELASLRVLRIAGRFRANELRLVRAAALDGAGIASLPAAMAAAALCAGSLVRVLPTWTLRPAPNHALWPARTSQPALPSSMR